MTQNIAVIAANGKSGQLIVREAVDRGLDVTAVVRGENKTVAQHAIIKDLFDLTAADLAGFDVVVDAFGAWTPETFPQHSTSLKHLADVLSSADARLIVVGGAGSLYVNPEHTVQLSQTDGFPEAFLPLATAMGILSPSCANVATCVGPMSLRPPTSRPTGRAPASMCWAVRSSPRTRPVKAPLATPIMRLRSWTKRRRHRRMRTSTSVFPCVGKRVYAGRYVESARRISSTPKSKRFRGACACGQDPNLHGDSGLLPLGFSDYRALAVSSRLPRPRRVVMGLRVIHGIAAVGWGFAMCRAGPSRCVRSVWLPASPGTCAIRWCRTRPARPPPDGT